MGVVFSRISLVNVFLIKNHATQCLLEKLLLKETIPEREKRGE